MTARLRWLAAAALAWAGCGGGAQEKPPSYPQAKLARADTSAHDLLELAPAGADVVIEVDLARVRANPVVGELFAVLTGAIESGFGGWLKADVVVFCGYSVGTADASNLVLARGGSPPDNATKLRAGAVAIGPPELVERAEALASGSGQAMARDRLFMRLRDAAMPAKASSASVRLTARLPFDARVGLAQLFDAESIPDAVSLWGDVVDDLAVVALLSGETADDGAALAGEVEALRGRLSRHPLVRAWRIADVVGRIEVEHTGNLSRAVLVIGPGALDKVVKRLNRKLAAR